MTLYDEIDRRRCSGNRVGERVSVSRRVLVVWLLLPDMVVMVVGGGGWWAWIMVGMLLVEQ